MDYLNKIKGWAKGIADVGVSFIALGIVLEILFNGQGIPFWPNVSVIGNVQGVLPVSYTHLTLPTICSV